jgi:hypothetical protein
VEGPRQRLLHVDVLAAPHGVERRDRVDVVGRGHHHGVDVLLYLVQHLPEILEALRVGMLREGVLGALVVDVAQGHELRARAHHGAAVALAHPADPDLREAQRLAARGGAGGQRGQAGEAGRHRDEGAAALRRPHAFSFKVSLEYARKAPARGAILGEVPDREAPRAARGVRFP